MKFQTQLLKTNVSGGEPWRAFKICKSFVNNKTSNAGGSYDEKAAGLDLSESG